MSNHVRYLVGAIRAIMSRRSRTDALRGADDRNAVESERHLFDPSLGAMTY